MFKDGPRTQKFNFQNNFGSIYYNVLTSPPVGFHSVLNSTRTGVEFDNLTSSAKQILTHKLLLCLID